MTIVEEVEGAIALYEQFNQGHLAQRTRSMISRYGVGATLADLVMTPDLQKGFKVLRDNGALDSTFEAIITRHTESFSAEVVEAAKWRIENAHGLPKRA